MAEKFFTDTRVMKIARHIIFLLSALISLGFLFSGFSVGMDPRVSMKLVLFSMTFPAWILAMIVITLAAALLRFRKSFALLLVAWIIGAYNVFSFSPFNIRRSPAEGERVFTLMTFNVFRFKPAGDSTPSWGNATLSSVINSGADIVALQEAFGINGAVKAVSITKAQYDSLAAIYPYRCFEPDGQALLSKYPFSTLPIRQPQGSATFACYKIAVDSVDFTLFNVHLQSFRLESNERKVYYEITDGDLSKQMLSDARNELMPKVKRALVCHAFEAEQLVVDIDSLSAGGAVIVCGDFNDVLGSYPMKYMMKECHLDDAYRKGALGPTYTYHGSRFYFNIDHILYRGFGKPLATRRLKVPDSDHYPLIATFPLSTGD